MQFIDEKFGSEVATLRDSHSGLLHYHISTCEKVGRCNGLYGVMGLTPTLVYYTTTSPLVKRLVDVLGYMG